MDMKLEEQTARLKEATKQVTDVRIDRSNFFKLTYGNFEPCEVPDREPDRRSGSSEYWFDKEGVTRRSDHWGSQINSCTWTLGGKPCEPNRYPLAEPCWKGKKLGQRVGRIAWDKLYPARVLLHLTHQFGELDYERIGAKPVRDGEDKYGPYDVFVVKRDWVSKDGLTIHFGENTIPAKMAGRSDVFTSAFGETYLDMDAQELSREWRDERERAKAEGRPAPELKGWLLDKAVADGDFIRAVDSLCSSWYSQDAGDSGRDEYKWAERRANSLAASYGLERGEVWDAVRSYANKVYEDEQGEQAADGRQEREANRAEEPRHGDGGR